MNDIEEADVHHCMNTSWLFGGVDMQRACDTQYPGRALRAVATSRNSAMTTARPK